MTVRLDGEVIVLSGDCPVEDAETLLGFLIERPDARVDVAGCGRVHSAVVQILLAVRPSLGGTPAKSFFSDWILPRLLDLGSETTSTG